MGRPVITCANTALRTRPRHPAFATLKEIRAGILCSRGHQPQRNGTNMLRHTSAQSPYLARTKSNLRLAALFLALMGLIGVVAARVASAQTSAAPAPVSRTTKAVNYQRKGTTLKIGFHGTDLMQQAGGEAKVENKGSRVEIDAKFEGFEDATKFGLEYLTYVLWAVSPQGRAVNLGE